MMPVSKKLKSIYNSFWEKPELLVANCISDCQEIKKLRNNIDRSFHLSNDDKRMIKEYWKPFCNISTDWCRYYYSKNGVFDPRYIPNTLYFTKIDQHFNNRKLGYGFNDKNYYSLLFPDVLQPRILVRKIGNMLFDNSYRQINMSTAIKLVSSVNEVIIKPSQESGSGRGIVFVNSEKDVQTIESILNDKSDGNILVQEVLEQHSSLSTIYPNSLNTIRITTLLLDDGVHILSSVLRMGMGNSRVDNASNGGISVGINSDGQLNKYAHILYKGSAIDRHPDGFIFDGFSIPNYGEIKETVKRLAQYTGNFKLVSWDMSIDKAGNVILIESNMRKGGIAIHQFNNGPLFGELTDKVLSEVFSKR